MGVGAAEKRKKMNRIKRLMIVAVMLLASSHVFAQTDVYVQLGASIPVGNFAAGDNQSFALLNEDTEGGAGFGFTAGVKLNFHTKVKGLGVIATVDGIFNGLNTEMRDYLNDLYDHYDSQFSRDFSLTSPKYLNFPLMAGLNYTYNINSKTGIYGEAALGGNLRVITNLMLSGRTDNYKEVLTYTYNTAFSFAYQLGAGVNLSDKFSIGLNYYNLGSAKVTGKVTDKQTYNSNTTNSSEKFKLKRITPTMIMIRLGYKF